MKTNPYAPLASSAKCIYSYMLLSYFGCNTCWVNVEKEIFEEPLQTLSSFQELLFCWPQLFSMKWLMRSFPEFRPPYQSQVSRTTAISDIVIYDTYHVCPYIMYQASVLYILSSKNSIFHFLFSRNAASRKGCPFTDNRWR